MALIFLALPCCRAETIEFLIEDSPYYLDQGLVVKEGQVLTVEPGVVVNMARDTSIIIEGRIEISGYPKGGEVIFKAQAPAQNYHKGFWQGIIIRSKEKNVLQYTVVQHSKVGIELSKDSSADITNNIITQNKTGIKAEGAAQFFVNGNSFLGNFIDIEIIEGEGSLQGNFFEGSLTCLKLNQGYPKIRGNFFKQAHKNVVESDNETGLSATGNYWGTADEDKIKDLIMERGKGRIVFKPFLEKPSDLNETGVDLKEDCASCQEKGS